MSSCVATRRRCYRLAADHIAALWVYDSDRHGLDLFAWSDS